MIESKNINKIIIGFVVIAVVFTSVFMLNPEFLGIKSQSESPQYADKLFPEDQIISINIKADPEEWNEMLENATAEEYISCDITINGETFYSVGIRPKGNSSLTMVAKDEDTDRFSFKIKMDEYVDDQTYYGLSKFVINNMQGDASYMKEYLSYDMFKTLGVSTPLCAFADISLNGEPWGFYLAIESVEEEFAERNYGTDYGMLYKPESQEMGGGGQKGDNQGNGNKTIGEKTNQQNSNTNDDKKSGMQPPDGAPQGGPGNDLGQGGPDGAQGQGMPGQDRSDSASGGAIDFGRQPPDREGNTSGGAMGFGGRRPDQTEDTSSKGAINPGGKMDGGGFGGSGSSSGANLVYTDDEIDSYPQIFDNAVFEASDADKEKIIAALKALSTEQNLENSVDVDEVARYFAANTALVNLDSYICSFQHNYYLYEEEGKISILPWDLNLSFGGFQSKNSTSAVNFPIDTPVTGVELSDRPLIGKLLENEEYKELYHSYLQKLVDEYFNSGYFEKSIDKLDDLISDHVKNDPSAFYTYDQYQAAVKALKTFGALRAQSIQGQLDKTVPSTSEEQSAESDKLIDASSLSMSTMGSQGNGGGIDKGSNFKNKN